MGPAFPGPSWCCSIPPRTVAQRPNFQFTPTRATKNSASSSLRPKPSPARVIGAPLFVTPTMVLLKAKLLLLLLSRFTHRPSSLTVRLLVQAYSPPAPRTHPQSLLFFLMRKPLSGATRAPAAAENAFV